MQNSNVEINGYENYPQNGKYDYEESSFRPPVDLKNLNANINKKNDEDDKTRGKQTKQKKSNKDKESDK